MRGPVLLVLAVELALTLSVGGPPNTVAQARVGAIAGRVRLNGKAPGNAIIRMGVDPLCRAAAGGARVVQESVVTSPEGGLANVFVSLEGAFPPTPVPSAPVTIDQRGCLYRPRVAGARVGQALRIRNSDPLLHNVHTLSSAGNSFNIAQPSAGMEYEIRLGREEGILQLKCDVHRWMTSYIGVVSHPYFAVSDDNGSFEIADVPVGTYRIRAWHERYGSLDQRVLVRPGATSTVGIVYAGTETASSDVPGMSSGR